MINETIENEVQQLAAAHAAGNAAARKSDGQYLRILITALQAQFDGKRRRPLTTADSRQHAEFIADTHTRLYAYVLKGVTNSETIDDPGIPMDERRARAAIRNSRAGFARSAASTLQAYIRSGGDLRGVDVATVTKGQLRAWVAEHTPGAANPRQTAAQAALKRLLRDAEALAAEDADAGREAIEGALDALQAALVRIDATHGGLAESAVIQGPRGARYRPAPAVAAAPA